MSAALLPLETITQRILLLRGQKVLLDSDLAELYGVETRRLNEQVRRNETRFPDDFMFQLSTDRSRELHGAFTFGCPKTSPMSQMSPKQPCEVAGYTESMK